MQEEGVNGYDEVRRQLGITSIRSKVEISALERIGHVLRMPNERMTKKVVLGSWLEEKTENGKLTGGLIAYWKRLIGETGEDWTNIENLKKNRKTWKTLINNRKANLTRWETDMCDHTRGHTKPTRIQARVVEDGFSCRWTGCDKICRSNTSAECTEKPRSSLPAPSARQPSRKRAVRQTTQKPAAEPPDEYVRTVERVCLYQTWLDTGKPTAETHR